MKITPAKLASQKAEYKYIVDILKKTNFKRGEAAALLGITRKTLYNKLKRYQSFAGTGKMEKAS